MFHMSRDRCPLSARTTVSSTLDGSVCVIRQDQSGNELILLSPQELVALLRWIHQNRPDLIDAVNDDDELLLSLDTAPKAS
jgi:hypothetical protein